MVRNANLGNVRGETERKWNKSVRGEPVDKRHALCDVSACLIYGTF